MTARAYLGLLGIIFTTGCAAEPDVGSDEQDVREGRSAAGHAYAGIMMRGSGAFCTGSLIAPRVVMTAAHCVGSATPQGIWVDLPGLGAQPEVSAWARYRDGDGHLHTGETAAGNMDFEQHDIALAILATPVQMDRYPARATRRTSAGSMVFGIGQRQGTPADPLLRSRDDDLEHDRPLNDRVRRGWAGDYLEPGDSGGPWVRAHDGVIMGVHRGGNGADNIYPIHQTSCWIAHVVEAYGGEGPQAPGGQVRAVDEFCE